MFDILKELLSDKKTDIVFKCFGIWHIIYMIIIFSVIVFCILYFKKKDSSIQQKLINSTINIAFSLYILDFFLMPFAYGQIDLEKLPFHACTAMCVMGFISTHNKYLSKFRNNFALLGLISNLIYVIYPAGVGWYLIHPLSYRVIQTLFFHGIMSAYGLFVLIFENNKFEWKNFKKEIIVLGLMTVWALIGNYIYNGTYNDKTYIFNWFFVIQDPFYMLPKDIAPYIMPFIVIASFTIVEIIFYLIINLINRKKEGFN